MPLIWKDEDGNVRLSFLGWLIFRAGRITGWLLAVSGIGDLQWWWRERRERRRAEGK